MKTQVAPTDYSRPRPSALANRPSMLPHGTIKRGKQASPQGEEQKDERAKPKTAAPNTTRKIEIYHASQKLEGR